MPHILTLTWMVPSKVTPEVTFFSPCSILATRPQFYRIPGQPPGHQPQSVDQTVMELFFFAGHREHSGDHSLLSSVTILESPGSVESSWPFLLGEQNPNEKPQIYLLYCCLYVFTAPLFSRRFLYQPGCPPPVIKDQVLCNHEKDP